MPLSLQWSMAIKVLRSREAMEELGGELEVHWKLYQWKVSGRCMTSNGGRRRWTVCCFVCH
jgi:hypothetical protein